MLPRCETSDYSPAQKISLFLGITFALILIAIIGKFVYDFIQAYHQWLSHALFYLLSVIGYRLPALPLWC